jgi:cytochrome c556
MNKQFLIAGLALMLGAGYSLTAIAQAKPETLVKQRQAAMTLQGKYFYPRLRPMAQGKIPYDANVAARDAGFLDALAKMPWDGFAASTKDLKTGALPAVYTDTAKFKESADHLQTEAAKLAALTKSGDEAAVKAQILAVDKACGSCHESFREKQ